MGVMSDLHILGTEAHKLVASGASQRNAVETCAKKSSYSVEDVEWAYRELNKTENRKEYRKT